MIPQLMGLGQVPVCDPGTVYSSFYQSCVTPCPAGQAYDATGICAAPGMSTTMKIAIGVGVVGAIGALIWVLRG